MEILILYRHLSTRLLVRFGITGAFHALPKAWFWGEKSLGSIKNSNRLSRKSVRTRRNRRRLSDSDFHFVFDSKRCEKPWKHGIFGVLSSAVIFRQIPPSSVFTTWLEMRLSARARGFESHRFRQRNPWKPSVFKGFFYSVKILSFLFFVFLSIFRADFMLFFAREY